MPAFPLLWPVIALVALTFVVWFILATQRFRHLKANPPGPQDLATSGAARRYFEPVELPANNLSNLLEVPVLFYVLALLLLQTELANDGQVVLAWIFVALRALHSWFHLRDRVRPRFLSYFASVLVLLAMWVGFAVDAAVAAHAYNETMATLEAQP